MCHAFLLDSSLRLAITAVFEMHPVLGLVLYPQQTSGHLTGCDLFAHNFLFKVYSREIIPD